MEPAVERKKRVGNTGVLVCGYVPHTYSTRGDQKRVSEPPELETSSESLERATCVKKDSLGIQAQIAFLNLVPGLRLTTLVLNKGKRLFSALQTGFDYVDQVGLNSFMDREVKIAKGVI
ncbi:hypothetical protein STEG23_038322 [Scotinomys teguina]